MNHIPLSSLTHFDNTIACNVLFPPSKKVEENRKYRMHDILTQKCVETSAYINARTVFKRCVLTRGRYILFPTTFKPQIMGEYMIRVFTDVDSICR